MAISIIKAPGNITSNSSGLTAKLTLLFSEVCYTPDGSKFIFVTDHSPTPIEVEVTGINPIGYTDVDYVFSVIKPLIEAALTTWYLVTVAFDGPADAVIDIIARTPGTGSNITITSFPEGLGSYPGSYNPSYAAISVLDEVTAVENNIACLAFNPVEYILQTDNVIATAGVKHQLRLQFVAFQAHLAVLTFSLFGKIITFTFRNTGPYGDYDIPINGVTMNDWVRFYIMPVFESNYLLSRYFSITYSTNNITFTAKENGITYILDATVPNANIVKTTIATGVDEVKKDNFNLLLDVYIETEYLLGDYQLANPNIGVPDAAKRVRFDIGKPLQALINPIFPNFSTLVGSGVFIANMARRYFIKYAEAFGEPIQVLKYEFFTSKSLTTALFGGNKLLNFKQTNLVDNYIKAEINKPLTAMPSGMAVCPTQPQYLTAMWPLNVTTSFTAKVMVKLFYDDGTFSDDILALSTVLDKKALLTYTVGYSQLGIDALKESGKTVVAYDVWLADNDVVQRTHKFSFTVNHDYFLHNRFFVFINSYGCLETAWFTGSKRTQTEMDNEVYNQVHYRDTHESTNVYEGDIIEDGHSTNYIFELSTGYKTKAYVDYIVEFFQSKKRYEILPDKLAMITIDKAKVELYDDNDTDFGFKFSYSYAWKEDGLA